MTTLLNRLARPYMLLITGLTMIGAMMLIRTMQPAAGGVLLDLQITGAAANALLESLSPAQRAAHLQLTMIGDTLYPLGYGGFWLGVVARFGGARRTVLALPMLLGVGFDFTENTLQALALADQVNWLAAKSVITPLKFLFVLSGIAIGIAAALWRLIARLRG